MNRIFVFSGVIISLGCSFFLRSLLYDKGVQKNGITVKAIIVAKSNDCNGSRLKSMTVRFNQKLFALDIDKN